MANYVVDAENTILSATAGDDTVIVYANGAQVHGNGGDDWISANLNANDYPDSQEIRTALSGGAGDDRIHASLLSLNTDPAAIGGGLIADLFGGDGDDQLWLDVVNYVDPFAATLNGGAGADDIRVTVLGDNGSYAGGGPITVDAGGGDDTFKAYSDGESGDVTVRAGDGNDLIEGHASYSEIDGSTWGAVYLYGDSGYDTLIGTGAVSNDADGGSGNDTIDLRGLFNTADGGRGDDRISAVATLSPTWNGADATGLNHLEGGAGNDRLFAQVKIANGATAADARSELYGGSGNDRLSVRGGEGNVLDGGSGADVLLGSEGVDILDGGGHADYMRGRDGADIFRFEIGDSSARNRDRIADFEIGSDVIDLSQIDANVARRGDQAFIVDGTEGRGHAWFVEDPDSTGTILMADNGRRVLEVLLIDGRGVEADHYSAGDFLL